MAQTMRAIRLHSVDGVAGVREDEIQRPEPTGEQVLVAVHAAGINHMVSTGGFIGEERLPITLGMDLAGQVEAVGDEVTEYDPGDEVFGRSVFVEIFEGGEFQGSGTFADYAIANPSSLAHIPDEVGYLEAGAIPTVGLTAGHALYDHAALEPGQRVLIHGAAGGVGHVAVQLARRRDAHVVGTASGYNEEYLRELGVDEFVNYREQRFEEVLDPVDIVLDTIGGETQTRSFEVLREGGRLVAATQPPDEDEAAARNVTASMVRAGSRPPVMMTDLADWMETGELVPTISETYSLADARAALQASEGQHARGKMVFDMC